MTEKGAGMTGKGAGLVGSVNLFRVLWVRFGLFLIWSGMVWGVQVCSILFGVV